MIFRNKLQFKEAYHGEVNLNSLDVFILGIELKLNFQHLSQWILHNILHPRFPPLSLSRCLSLLPISI